MGERWNQTSHVGWIVETSRVAIPKVVLVFGWLFEAVGEFTVGKIENGLGEI